MTKCAESAVAISLISILLAAGCTDDSDARNERVNTAASAIVVGSFDFSESQILAEAYASALESHGFRVRRLGEVASREIMEPALEQEFVDLVPEYQGTALAFLSPDAPPAARGPQETHDDLSHAFADRGIAVLDFAPAQNRNEVVVTDATAKRFGLESISDLQRVASGMVVGGPPECPSRSLCLQGLDQTYGLRFEAFLPLDAGGPLTVAALNGGEIDVALLFTTSPAIPAHDFVVLDDDRHLQPSENVVPVIRKKVLDIYGDELADIVNSVTARLSTATLQKLNRRVEVGNHDPIDVARAWLEEEGISP